MIKVNSKAVIKACDEWLLYVIYKENDSILYEAHKSSIEKIKELAYYTLEGTEFYEYDVILIDQHDFYHLKDYL